MKVQHFIHHSQSFNHTNHSSDILANHIIIKIKACPDYSEVQTYLKASGVNFRDWLVFFLDNVHKYDDDYNMDLAELLPHNFKIKKNLEQVASHRSLIGL